MIGIITTVFLLSAGFYFVLNSQIRLIENERAVLTKLRTSLASEAIFFTSFSFKPLAAIKIDSQPFTENTNASFAALDSITYLPKKLKAIKESIQQINAMKGLINDRRTALDAAIENFLVQGEKVGGFRSSLKLIDFSLIIYYSKKEGYPRFLELSNALSSGILVMNQSFISSISIIDEQYEIIDGEIQAYKTSSVLTAFLIAVILGTLGIFLSVIAANRISRKITRIQKAIRIISSGDLSLKFDTSGTDEIGELGVLMEEMRNNLTSSIREIQQASTQALDSRNQLDTSVTFTDEAVSRLTGESSAIQNASAILETNIQKSQTAISSISQDVHTVSTMIQSQAAMVEESTAAITQMASSISSLNSIMENNKEGSSKLISAAVLGENRLTETSEIIQRINQNITTIQSMADMISSIAARTNLLAMNAAIEAAHAGEFGAGFSVVADEIRILAEASAVNSKTIVKNLKEVIGNIKAANTSSGKTSESFKLVQSEIHLVSDRFDEIVGSLLELKEGGNQIMEAMVELNTYTTSVTDNTEKITRQTGLMSTSIDAVRESAESVAKGNSRIQDELLSIQSSFTTVDDRAKAIGKISDQLNTEASKFKI